ncbi:MAG: hypothetical protein QMB11_03540, partial [Nonlabens sp.]|uniref:beta strand repeat-containing protein n=1 Tax=Nonlabens sp. TaxID=1888209 RepID=UPI0035A5A28C
TLYGNLTAPTFIGGLTGNANTATKLANINTNFSGTYPLTVNVNGEIYSNAAITYNGSSGELKAPTFIGNLSGNLFGSVPFIYSTTLGTAYNQTVQIREKGLNGPQGQSMAAAPRLAFHWSGQVASSIAMEANGRIAIMNNPGTGYENLIARDIISSGGIFSGPGTGLTGTATGLTVGNANYANSAGSATDSTKLPLTGGTLTGEVQTAKRKIFSLNLGSQVDTWYLLATVNTGNSGINIRGTINNHVTSNGVQQFDLSIYGRKDNAGSQIEVSGHYSVGAAGVGILVVKSGVGTTYEQYDVYLKARAYTQCEAILTIQGFTTSIVLYDISNSTTTRPTGTAVEFDNTSDAKGFYSVEASSQSRIRTENNFTSGITANNWASGDDARINNGQSAFTSLGNYLPLAGGLMSGSIARSVPESGYQIGNYNLSNNASNTNPIYVIGSNFRPTDTVLNNMYGIGYTNTQSAFLNSTDLGVTPSGWGLYVAAAGKARVFLDADTGHIYGKGNVYAQQGIFRSNLTLGASNISNGQRSELNMYSYDNGAQQVGTLATNYSDGVRSIHLFGNANNQQIKIDASANVNGKIILMPGSSGNVGIGTTTPSEKLEVFSTLATGSWLKINPSAPGRESGIKIRQSTTYGADIYFNDAVGTDKGIKIDYVNVDTRYNALFITPSTNPSVGLGTYTPTEKLEVVGNVKATNFYGNLVGSAETLSNVTIQNINTITNGTLGSQVQDAFDFNLATNSGVYEVIWGGFIANSPQSWTAGSNHYGLLVCDGRFNSRFIQTISESSGPASFYRVQNGSVWGAWTSVITSANIGAQSVTYATTAGTASNGSNTNQHYNVIAGGGNGLRFWNGSDSFKVSMSNGSLFQYGTVTDYSIKMQMDQGSTGRGFTWGRQDITPIASLNSTSGNFQTAGTINALGGFIGAGTGLTGAASALSIGGSARLINIGSTSTISDLNIVTTDNAVRFDTFTTPAVNKPAGGNNANGVITFTTNHGSQYGKQIAFVDNDDLYIRRLTGGTYASWLSVMHSGNIGSQSVNYANSAGNATSSTNAVNANNADHISTFN